MSDTNDIRFPISAPGADEAVQEIQKVDKAATIAQKNRDQQDANDGITGFRGQLDNSISRDWERKQDAAIRAIENTTQKVHVAQIAYYDLGAAIKSAGDNSENLGGRVSGAGVHMKNMGMATNAISYQLQDFAVQVQGGTSAVRAFSQQAPQLIGQLSMAGVFTGGWSMALMGVAAAIPIVVGGFQALMGSGDQLIEKSKNVDEALAKTSTQMSEMRTNKLQEAATALQESADAAKALTIEYPLTKKAEEEYTKTALTNAELRYQALKRFLEAMGIQLNEIKELDQAEMRAAERRKVEAANEIAELERTKAAAQKAVSDKFVDQDKTQKQISNNIAALKLEKQEYEALVQKVAQAKQEVSYVKPVAGLGNDPRSQAQYVAEQAWKARAPQRENAQEFLAANPNIDDKIEKQKQKIDGLEANQKALEHTLNGISLSVDTATKNAADVAGEMDVKIKGINETLDAQNFAGKLDLTVKKSEQNAKDIDAEIAKITPLTDQAKTTISDLKTLTSDHKIAVDEASKASTLLSQLNQELMTNQAEVNGTFGAHLTAIQQLRINLNSNRLEMERQLALMKQNQAKGH